MSCRYDISYLVRCYVLWCRDSRRARKSYYNTFDPKYLLDAAAARNNAIYCMNAARRLKIQQMNLDRKSHLNSVYGYVDTDMKEV